MRERVIYHLERKVEEELDEKAKESRKEVGQVSITLAVFCSLTVNLMVTDHSVKSTFASPWLFSLTNCSPLPQGPRKLLFRSLVQQIHTDARGRRTGKERGFLSTCPQHTHTHITADLETICFFVNKRHAEELMREVVSLFNVYMDS